VERTEGPSTKKRASRIGKHSPHHIGSRKDRARVGISRKQSSRGGEQTLKISREATTLSGEIVEKLEGAPKADTGRLLQPRNAGKEGEIPPETQAHTGKRQMGGGKWVAKQTREQVRRKKRRREEISSMKGA